MEAHKEKRILAAASDLFGSHGFKRVAIDEIAKKAGVSKGTVYNYAESKDDLFFKVVDQELTAWVHECGARLDDTKPAENSLLENGLYAFNYLDSKPVLRQLLIEDIDYSLRVWVEKLDHIRKQCASNCSRILEIGVQQGKFRKDLDIANTALVLNDVLIHALIMKYKKGPSEALVWATSAMDLMLRGLRA